MLESEGAREAEINIAEGKKQSRILASEATKAETINQAAGQLLTDDEFLFILLRLQQQRIFCKLKIVIRLLLKYFEK